MKKTYLKLIIPTCALFLAACASTPKPKVAGQYLESEVVTNKILTREAQSQLTPEIVLNQLKQGNQDYISDALTVRNNSDRIAAAVHGQYPMAVILSCLDSRVPVEDVFHTGIGDLFVARVAGNVVNTDMIASMEFACRVAGSKVVLVLGHGNCGAVRYAIQGVDLGHIGELLAKIEPAVVEAKNNFSGEAVYTNPNFVESVCEHNVHLAVQQIRDQSPILKEMEDKGEIKIVGGYYNLGTGQVSFYE